VGCREEVIAAARAVTQRSGQETFGVADIVREMQRRGTSYAESTIRTHVTSRMCADAPDHHATAYADLERLDRNVYRLTARLRA
jgi:hypothetical protein